MLRGGPVPERGREKRLLREPSPSPLCLLPTGDPCVLGAEALKLPVSSYSREACLFLRILNRIPAKRMMEQTAIALMTAVTREPDSEDSNTAKVSECL